MKEWTSAQVLRVNHAGERGAISIYRAQIMLSRHWHRELVPTLSVMLSHEEQHFEIFDTMLRSRRLRPCHALNLWSLGGFLLGLFTALLGSRAIWTCTAAIESAVNDHLRQQMDFLHDHD